MPITQHYARLLNYTAVMNTFEWRLFYQSSIILQWPMGSCKITSGLGGSWIIFRDHIWLIRVASSECMDLWTSSNISCVLINEVVGRVCSYCRVVKREAGDWQERRFEEVQFVSTKELLKPWRTTSWVDLPSPTLMCLHSSPRKMHKNWKMPWRARVSVYTNHIKGMIHKPSTEYLYIYFKHHFIKVSHIPTLCSVPYALHVKGL